MGFVCFVFLLSSPCRYPASLIQDLCYSSKNQALGYSRVVDGTGGRHSTAICSKHRDVACAHTFISVVVGGLPQVVIAEWMVTRSIYFHSDVASGLVRQQGRRSHLQSQQGHWASITKAQACLSLDTQEPGGFSFKVKALRPTLAVFSSSLNSHTSLITEIEINSILRHLIINVTMCTFFIRQVSTSLPWNRNCIQTKQPNPTSALLSWFWLG